MYIYFQNMLWAARVRYAIREYATGPCVNTICGTRTRYGPQYAIHK